MTSEADLVREFQAITGADPATSRFYLESSSWSLSAATETFFETGGQSTASHKAPPPAAGAGRPQPASAASQPAGRTQPRGGIRGLSDLASEKSEGQDYYTGGKASGMVVQDPQGPPSASGNDIVSQLMENARSMHGGAPLPEEPQPKPARPVFTGSGYRLGNEIRPSEKIAPQPEQTNQADSGPVTRVLTFYRQGFTVDDGPLRSYTDPAEAEFLADIGKGIAPTELEREANGRQLSVNLVDKKQEDYKPPPKTLTPFSGSGQRLGGPSAGTTPKPTSTNASAPRRQLVVDETQPTTSVQIRLHDGTRLVAKFNHTHTVGDLRAFVDSALPKKVAFQLQTTLPVRVLSDDSQTLAESGLLGATVVQRPL